jgi:hypothetical protein
MNAGTYKISDRLYLAVYPMALGTAKTAAAPSAVNHIVVIDCSGSMSWDLPKIRAQLKSKLPKLMGKDDTITIIWFSGRGQCGILLEAEAVASLTDLQAVNRAIDRWLQPVGLTGFKEPLEKVAEAISSIRKKNSNPFSLFFMSDGCDNQWGKAEILKAVDIAGVGLSSATFVEYGFYADRPLLTAMAEKAGGTLIFADAFDKYEPQFEATLSKKVSGAKRVSVRIPENVICNFAFTVADGDLTTYAVENGFANIPEDTKTLYYFTDFSATAQHLPKSAESDAVLYAALSLYSLRMKAGVVLDILKFLGDVNFIDRFGTCFGKQRYSEFMGMAKDAAFNPGLRFVSGVDYDRVPPDDAFTVLDLLEMLQGSEDNMVCFDHPDFEYSRIGRARVNADAYLSAEEQVRVAQLSEQIGKEKKVTEQKRLQAELDAIISAKKPLEFEPDAGDKGMYSIRDLVYNEDRPNVSIRIRKTGKVDITSKVPAEHKRKLPPKFPTFIYRTYTIVKDGLINIKRLPVRVDKATADKIKVATGTTFKKARGEDLYDGVLTLDTLPVVNRKMVKEASAKALFQLQWDLMVSRAAQKVFKAYKDELMEKKESASYKLTEGSTPSLSSNSSTLHAVCVEAVSMRLWST